jgi:drug/metabolite transporter (DMT)-like permease
MAESQAREALNTEATTPEGAAPKKTGSFLNPTGVKAKEAPPKAIGPVMELVVFFIFVLVRAAHPVVIASSKTEVDGKLQFAYQSSSTVIVMTVSMCIAFLVQCYALGGKQQFGTIWESRPFIIFSINGIVYALGDYLEMSAIGGLPAAAYQILQQSRIILTALLMIPAKGLYQTRLQWTLLAILTFAMSTYMIIASGKKDGEKTVETDSSTLVMGTIFAFLKVVISCVGAVISDKYMKEFKNDPTHVCIARTFVARAIAIVLLSFTQDTWVKGFFSGWDAMTIAVTASFIIKSVSTLYIVALLDSILKNIAEAFSVLVIYAYDVLAIGKPFEIATFLSVLVVVAACAAYVDSKTPIEKAKKWDKIQEQENKAKGLGA